jgi:hypothetical protein
MGSPTVLVLFALSIPFEESQPIRQVISVAQETNEEMM